LHREREGTVDQSLAGLAANRGMGPFRGAGARRGRAGGARTLEFDWLNNGRSASGRRRLRTVKTARRARDIFPARERQCGAEAGPWRQDQGRKRKIARKLTVCNGTMSRLARLPWRALIQAPQPESALPRGRALPPRGFFYPPRPGARLKRLAALQRRPDKQRRRSRKRVSNCSEPVIWITDIWKFLLLAVR
jgi:hypothetical protein